MKQETAKKTPKWLLPVIIAAAVLVIAGIVLAIVLGGGSQQGQQQQGPVGPYELYWNVDREANVDPETNLSARQPGADGKYAIRFAFGGKQTELYTTDRRLVNTIDALDLMGLVFDDNGLIIDALPPTAVATEVTKDSYVKSFDGTTLVVNSSMAMNGMDQTIQITENTGIYNVDFEDTKNVGEAITELSQLDKVSVYANAEGVVTHVFMTRRPPQSDIYYRVTKMMADGVTTRVPDENGVYTVQMAHKGQLVDLKCRDVNVVNIIDTGYYTSAIMGLRFDEEGYIIGWVSPEEAMRGKLLYRDYTVTAIDGTTVSMESVYFNNSDIGTTATMEVDENCEIYLVEDGCEAEFIGQAVPSLKVGDQMYVYSDLEGKPIMIFINRRRMFSPMYYIVKRTGPDEKGYYVFDVIVDGKQKQVRTKDLAMADKVSKAGAGVAGLELKGDIITAVAQNACVCGGGSLAGRFVTETMGSIVRLVQSHDANQGTNIIYAPGFAAYDVSGNYGVPVGSKTELRKGDAVTGFYNDRNELVYAFVTQRYVEGSKNYFNVNRSYDFSTEQTTRLPDADGYYVFDMACEGKQVQVKTKDKDMASWIDKQSDCFPALVVSKGIIKGAYGHMSSIMYCRIQMKGTYYDYVDDSRVLHYYIYQNGEKSPRDSGYFRVAKDVVVYDCSNGYRNFRGEKSTMKTGDTFTPYIDGATQEIVMFVVGVRKVDTPLSWNTNRMYNSSTGETTRTPDADGYYVYQMAVDGEIKTYKTKDKAVADDVDSYSAAMGLVLDGDIIKRVVLARHTVNATEVSTGSGFDVQSVKGRTLTIAKWNSRYEADEDYGKNIEVKLAKNCKILDVSASAKTFGEKTTLVPGDQIVPYYNEAGEATYIFVNVKMTRKAGYISHCEHCDKEVRWEPLSWSIWGEDTHYYLAADAYNGRMNVGYTADQLAKLRETNPAAKQQDIVIDLNGNELSGSSYNFDVYGTFSIFDTVGTGKMLSSGEGVKEDGSGGRYGGNICVYEQGVLNIYSGTLTAGEPYNKMKRGGVLYGSSGTINMYGGTICGGYAEDGGNIYLRTDATFNMYGGTITGGKANYGGNFYALGEAKINLYGGTVSDGVATDRGGNFRVQGQAATQTTPTYYITLNVGKDVVISGGTAGRTGGSMHLTMTNTTIDGIVEKGSAGTAEGGNLYLDGDSKVTINGQIKDNVEAGTGGNIKMDAGVQLLLTGSVTGGNATAGGNIYAAAGTRLVVDGGTVSGIKVAGSNNIYIAGAEGKQTDLVLSGLTTDGDITVGEKVNVSLIGKLNIPKGTTDGLRLMAEGTLIDVAQLDAASSVVIEAGGVFTTAREDIGTIQNVFIPLDEDVEIATENNALVYQAKILTPVEKAEMLGAWAEEHAEAFATGENLPNKCPVCGAKGVNWEPLSNASYQNDGDYGDADNWGLFGTNGNHHFYLTEDINLADKVMLARVDTNATVCFFMNKNITSTGRFVNAGTLNMFGPGTYTYAGGNDKTMFQVYNPTVAYNFYGGTYTNTSTASSAHASKAMFAMAYSREINIYGGTFNTGNIALYRPWDANGSTLNIHGGTFNGGNVTMIDLSYKNGTVNIYGGEINGGDVGSKDGAVISVANNGAVNIHGGVIQNGKAYRGGNIFVAGGAFYMDGGSVLGGTVTKQGGNIYVRNISVTIEGTALIADGKGATAENGDNIYLETWNSAPHLNLGGSAVVCDGENDNVTIKAGSMYMYGYAQIIAKQNGVGSALLITRDKSGGVGSSLIIDGHATITTRDGNPRNACRIYAIDAAAPPTDYLFITNDWAGTAYFYLSTSDYATGSTVASHVAQCGAYDALAGTKTVGGSFTGTLYISNKDINNMVATGVDGAIIMGEPAAAE